ncbi:putative Myb/SANT-like domain-containing protein [Arabidopsis thaliana]
MMGDPPRGKEKGPYNQWTPDETDLTVESKLLPALNKRLGCNKNHKNYLSRLKFLKNLYQSCLDLKRFTSGFGWDPETKKFIAPDEVWRDYLKAHPNHKHMQTESIDHFEDAVATSSFAVGMSDSTCPRIYTVGERSQGKEMVNQDENIEEVYEFSSQPIIIRL